MKNLKNFINFFKTKQGVYMPDDEEVPLSIPRTADMKGRYSWMVLES